MMQMRGGGGIDWESIAKGMCDSQTTFSIPVEAGLLVNVNQICGYRYGLTSAVIPSGATSMAANVFLGCSALTYVDIPDTITSIGNQAFRSCTSLTDVVCRATTPPTLGSNVFLGDSGLTIYVPDASVSTYQGASGWSAFTIKPISERP